MPITPQQTIVDTSQDPSLGYIQSRDIQTTIAAGGTVRTSTDRAIITNTVENVTRSVTTVIETNVNADWNAITGDAQILNKPIIPSISGLATETYVNSAVSTKENTITAGTTSQYWRGDKTWQTLDKIQSV